MSDASSTSLTPEERGRLRPGLNLVALERLLAAVPPHLRAITLLHFYELPTASEALHALEASGVEEYEFQELRALAEHVPLPPHLSHSENDPDPDWVPPVHSVQLSIDPPDDAELRALWEAVERGPER
jgi:hypothetical protein